MEEKSPETLIEKMAREKKELLDKAEAERIRKNEEVKRSYRLRPKGKKK
jgi:hypothetical protein